MNNKHIAKIRSLDEHIALAKRYSSGTSYNMAEKQPGYLNDYRTVRNHYNCKDFAKLAGWKVYDRQYNTVEPNLTKQQKKNGCILIKSNIKEQYENLPKLDKFSGVDIVETVKLSQRSNATNLLRQMEDIGLLIHIGDDMLHQRGRRRHLYKRSANWKFKAADTTGNWFIAKKS